MNKISTLKYHKGIDNRLRRIITYRDLFNIEYRIKVFPITAQELLEVLQ